MPEETLSQECVFRAHLRHAVFQCGVLYSRFVITAVTIKIQTEKNNVFVYMHKWVSYYSWSGRENKMIGIFLAQQD